jgi:hypothetical protein
VVHPRGWLRQPGWQLTCGQSASAYLQLNYPGTKFSIISRYSCLACFSRGAYDIRNVLFKYTHYGVAEALNSGKNQPRTPFIPVDIFIAG